MSLKFENVVPEGWRVGFDFSRAIRIYVMFLLLYEHVRVRVMAVFLFFRARAAKKQACGTIYDNT